MKKLESYQAGITLIEMLVALGILAVMLVAIGFSVTAYVNARSELVDETKATYLAEEGYELLRAIRDNNWNSISGLSSGTTYYLAVSTTTLAIGTTPEIIDGRFRRSFVVRTVLRNASGDIVSSGSTIDLGSKQIDISVAGPTGTTTLSAVLTNLQAI